MQIHKLLQLVNIELMGERSTILIYQSRGMYINLTILIYQSRGMYINLTILIYQSLACVSI